MNLDLNQVRTFVQIINQVNPLAKEEWQLLYARLYFPTQFYDALYNLRADEEIDVPALYEQAMQYSKLLYQLPYEVYQSTLIELRVPEWVQREAKYSN